MEDKDDKSLNPPRSMSSSLSDSWSVVNKQGEVLDDDSCSTASSVEVVEEDEEEDESRYPSLSTSQSTIKPSGPLFVLRLSSHDVSDTDEDQTSSVLTDSITDSQSFDILAGHGHGTGKSQKLDQVSTKSEGQTADMDQTKSHSQVKEEVESLVKAIDEVQKNLKPDTDVLNGSVTDGGSMSIPENQTDPITKMTNKTPTERPEVLVETIGIKPTVEDEHMVESVSSNFSFLGTDKDTSPAPGNQDIIECTLSPVMNMSMERTETAGNQDEVQSSETVEPDTVTSTNDLEVNQSERRGHWFGEQCKQLYSYLKNRYAYYRQGDNGISIQTSLCFVVVVVGVCFVTMYTTCSGHPRQNKTNGCQQQYDSLLDKYSYVERELETCTISEESLKLKLENDKHCASSLKEASQIIRKWTYTSPDKLESEVDKYLSESTFYCGRDQGSDETSTNQDLDMLERKVNTLAFLLKRIISENTDLKDSLQASVLEITKLKTDLENSEFINAQNEKKPYTDKKIWSARTEANSERTATKGQYTEKEEFVGGEEAGGGSTEDEDAMFYKCLNLLVTSNQNKFKEAFQSQYEWTDYGSRTVRDYLFGYLHDIVPENLMHFLQRMNGGGSPPNQDDENSDTPTFTNQDNSNSDDTNSWENEQNKFREDKSDYTRTAHWTESVLDIMNKTRTDLLDTWKQVKNISEEMWTRHEPAITKLQNTFTKKFQQLSDKFQEKLAKKMKKWFYKAGQRKGNKETNRPEDAKGEGQANGNKERQYICDKDVISVQQSILSLNANSFKKTGNERNILKQLKRIRRRKEIPESSPVKTWLDCQIDWWSNNYAIAFEMPQYLISDACFDFVECWQIEVSEGEYGIGRKKCRKLKRASGNVIVKACKGVEYVADTDEGDDDEDLHHSNQGEDSADCEQHEHSDVDDSNDSEDDVDTDDVTGDEEVENWYIQRAEMRKYMHDEPDDWYFRRFKKWKQETSPYNDL